MCVLTVLDGCHDIARKHEQIPCRCKFVLVLWWWHCQCLFLMTGNGTRTTLWSTSKWIVMRVWVFRLDMLQYNTKTSVVPKSMDTQNQRCIKTKGLSSIKCLPCQQKGKFAEELRRVSWVKKIGLPAVTECYYISSWPKAITVSLGVRVPGVGIW